MYFDSRQCVTHSVDHVPSWVQQVSRKVKGRVLLEEDLETYVMTLRNTKELWDIVLIDGEERVKCAREFLEYQKTYQPKLLIFDNSNWYPETCRSLIENTKWFPLRLNGFGPINIYPTQTLFLINPRWIPKSKGDSRPLGSDTSVASDDLSPPGH